MMLPLSYPEKLNRILKTAAACLLRQGQLCERQEFQSLWAYWRRESGGTRLFAR
jgi:hypothetical protein